MDIVKKNLVSIIFGVIAILAVVGNFFPMAGKRVALKSEAESHAQKAEELHGLLTKERNLPVVQPGSTENSPLPGFPTHQALEAAHTATEQVNKAADALMETAATTNNKHTPLVDRALPGQPGETLPASSFARAYVGMFPPPLQQGQIAVAPEPTSRPADAPATLMDILHAVDPPSDLELTAARNDKQTQIQNEVTRRDAGGNVTNQDEVVAAVTAAFKSIGDDMRTARAKQCKVWVAPDAFSIYPGMTVQATPDATSIFWAQIGLWTQEDVCHAIFEMNESATDVMDAPVKELVKISFLNSNQPNSPAQPSAVPVFVMPNLQPAGGVGTGGPTEMAAPTPADPNAPATPPMDPNAAIPKNILLSPTGRICNGLFDVEHFELELIVDAGKVPQVLEGIGGKRYISVIQVENVDTVDAAYFRGAGYYFGKQPCVRLKLRCEELFFRKWLADYVPTRLKTMLGYPPPAAAAPPA